MTSPKKTDSFKSILGYAAAVICGCVFILLSASWVSPLFKDAYGYDSSWYSMMGRAITQGMVPYRDYFDLKGPVFFFIEAIGQVFHHGRLGIFFIECVAASFSAVFILKLCRLYLKWYQTIGVFILLAYCMLVPLWGGNTCEEYMLPFNYACIYLAMRYLKEEKYGNYTLPAIVFGISFGIMMLSKITTCAPMAAAALTVVIVLISKREFRYILPILGLFVAGVLMIFIPVSAYFAFNHAFKDFIYAAFVFAYKRGTDYYETFSYDWEMKTIACYVAFIAFLIHPSKYTKQGYLRIFGLVLSVITWAALHLGTPYDYYFLLTMPVFVVMLIMIISNWFYAKEDIKKLEQERDELSDRISGRREGGEDSDAASSGIVPSTEGIGNSTAAVTAEGTVVSEIQTADGEAPEGTSAEHSVYFLKEKRRKIKKKIFAKNRLAIQRRILWVILILVVMDHFYFDFKFKVTENYNLSKRTGDDYVEQCKEVLTYIPENKWNEIFDLESGMIFYEVNQLLPANRYPINLPYFMHLDPGIKSYILQYLDLVRPYYIMSEQMDAFDDEDVKNYVFSHYILYEDTGAEEIYVRED